MENELKNEVKNNKTSTGKRKLGETKKQRRMYAKDCKKRQQSEERELEGPKKNSEH